MYRLLIDVNDAISIRIEFKRREFVVKYVKIVE